MILLLALGLGFALSLPPAAEPPGFSFLGKPHPEPYGLFSFTITNESRFATGYGVLPPQVQSNGVWPQLSLPASGFGVQPLPARGGTTLSVKAPPGGEAWRVPVLWAPTPRGLQQVFFFAQYSAATILGRPRPRGPPPVFHTNYSAEVRP